MVREVKGGFSGGRILPPGKLDLAEGVNIAISVNVASALEQKRTVLGASAGSWKGMRDPDGLTRTIYAARRTGSHPASRPDVLAKDSTAARSAEGCLQ